MTREEAIQILWQYDVNFEPHPAEEIMHAIDMAIEALKAQENMIPLDGADIMFVTPEEYKAHEWIPCSERLPEIYIPVILSGKHNEVIGYRRNDSDWMAFTGDGWETDIEHPEDFIAWMPLPPAYEGE